MGTFLKIFSQAIPAIIKLLNKKKTAEQAPLSNSKPEAPIYKQISFEDYVTAMGRYPERLNSADLTDDVKKNIQTFLPVLNALLKDLGVLNPDIVSGFRTRAVNSATPNAAPKSNHLTGLACDIADKDASITKHALLNLAIVKKHGCFLEDPRWTKGWLHIQIKKPLSGKRVFAPSTAAPTNPSIWDGIYPKEYDEN